MTTKLLTGILSLFLCAISFTGCSNDDKFPPITLEYENPQIKFNNETPSYRLSPFADETTPLFIKGGDGNYKVTNDHEEVIQLNYDGRKISFKPKALGNATIRIEDGSENVYILPVTVKYGEYSYTVYDTKPIVKGDKLTVEEMKTVQREVMEFNTIEKYAFTFKDAEYKTGTVVLHYKDKSTKEYSFEQEHIKLDEANAIVIKDNYKLYEYNRITINDSKGDVIDTFGMTKNFLPILELKTRMNSPNLVSYCLIRDLTERYKVTYPAVEKAYQIRVASWRYN